MKKIEEYIDNVYKLVKTSEELNLNKKCIITGGFCANSYFSPHFRRYSNDIDFLVSKEEISKDFNGPLKHESGVEFYYKKVGENLYIFLIVNKDTKNYPLEEIGTFNEYFSEKGSKFLGRRLKEHEILETKMKSMISRFRGAEAIKDAYDISLLVNYMDGEVVKEVIEQLEDNNIPKIASYIISMKKFKDSIKRKIQPLIVSGEFPEKIYDSSVEKLEKFAKGYRPEEVIVSSVIFSLSRKENREILGKIGVRSDRTKDVIKVLDEKLSEIDIAKKNKFAEEIIQYGKKAVIKMLYEIFEI